MTPYVAFLLVRSHDLITSSSGLGQMLPTRSSKRVASLTACAPVFCAYRLMRSFQASIKVGNSRKVVARFGFKILLRLAAADPTVCGSNQRPKILQTSSTFLSGTDFWRALASGCLSILVMSAHVSVSVWRSTLSRLLLSIGLSSSGAARRSPASCGSTLSM